MNLERFVEWTKDHWHKNSLYTEFDDEVTHAVLGLVTESAEVADLFKKTRYTPKRLDDINMLNRLEDELGDVLHYWAVLVRLYHLDVRKIMERNVNKIEVRYGE